MSAPVIIGTVFTTACLVAVGLMIVSSVAAWLVDRRTKKELDEIEREARRM